MLIAVTDPVVSDFLSQSQTDPDTKGLAYLRMAERWELLQDLLGGTIQMRKRGTKWLPQEPAEEDAKYEIRLNRSVLYGAFRETLNRVAAKPFAKEVVVRGDIGEQMSALVRNVNRGGRNLTQFAADIFWDGWFYGLGHFLMDTPAAQPGLSLAAQRRAGVFPYFVRLGPDQIIDWRTELNNAGVEVLTEMRVLSLDIEPDGEFGSKQVARVRRYRAPLGDAAGELMEWTRDVTSGAGSWIPSEPREYRLKGPNGGIPLFTFYVNWCGFMEAEPPLEDLAWENLHHWQSSSDQFNALRFARMAILALFGFDRRDLEETGGIVIGPNATLATKKSPQDADAKFVEHSGAAIEAGRRDILDTEDRMERLGHALLRRDAQNVTATGQHANIQGAKTSVQAAARALQGVLNDAFRWASEVGGEPLPEDFAIDVFDEFDESLFGDQSLEAILKARQLGDLSREDLLIELKKRGILSAGFDVEAALARTEAEGANLADLGMPEQ